MKIFNKLKIRYIICTIVAMGLATAFVAFKQDSNAKEMLKNLEIFTSLYREVVWTYVDDVDTKKIVRKAIDEMLEELDPYTNYIPEEDMGDFMTMTTGEYGGVGSIISISDTNYIMVREIYPGNPAHEAGLQAGDFFIEVAGENVVGKKVSDVSDLLRGKPDTDCKLKILRNGKEIETKATRRKIQLNPVHYYGMLDDKTGYIELSNFTQNCADEVKKAFIELRDNKKAKKLILDLRGNPGGLLDEAIKTANLFLPRYSHILTQKGKYMSSERMSIAPAEPVDTIMPIVVMISRGSASASEIVAGALQDWDRAVIVGQRSFGKGLVQSTRGIAHKGALKVTTAKYYIPSGRCIQAVDYTHRDKDGAVGLVPDSLIKEFKTKHGRKVFDGGGVSPDIHVTLDTLSNATIALVAADIPFHYGVKFRREHPRVTEDYKMTDADFADFCKFVQSRKKFTYKNRSNEALKKLIDAAKADKYYSANAKLLTQLEELLAPNLTKDLNESKKEICEILEQEIILGKYFRSASLKHGLKTDKVVAEAMKLLNDMNRYNGLLDGTIESHAGDKRTSSASKK